jgi:glycosyltransferase involved in cell wall biosynthesis
MDMLKGGGVLLDALPHVLKSIGQPLHLRFVGDGPERRKWEEKAAAIQAYEKRLKIEFTGWLEKTTLELLFHESHLLVVPSLWPEPFGLVGPEAGLHGLPAAASTVGGIPEWLIDGVNGCLAPVNLPTAEGLAKAVARCLQDPAMYGHLKRGALRMANKFRLVNHVGQLTDLFNMVVSSRPL